MRFGLYLIGRPTGAAHGSAPIASPDFLVPFAQHAEEVGIESLFFVDHIVFPADQQAHYPYTANGAYPYDNEEMQLPEPVVLFAFLAGVTVSLRFGTAVLVLPQRNPLLLAKQLATVDRLSGGRVELGIGAGWLEDEFRALGSDFATRGPRTDEHLEVLRTLWRDDIASYHGATVAFDRIKLTTRPLQPGGVPIIVGGHSPPALRRAGRYGDAFLPAMSISSSPASWPGGVGGGGGGGGGGGPPRRGRASGVRPPARRRPPARGSRRDPHDPQRAGAGPAERARAPRPVRRDGGRRVTVRLVQIGTGFWGASWAPLLREHADVELVALVDIDPAASARVAAEIGLGNDRCFTTVDDALTAGLDLDAALVVVQPEHHEAVTVPALRAGLHCLVEKPIAHTVASARAIVDEGQRANRVVMVSQNYRFARAPRTVQRLVAGGAIGAVEQVRVDYQTLAELEGFFTKIPEPIISRWFIHQGDLVRGVLGVDPVRVRATSWNPSWSRFEGNASCLVEMWTESGAHIVYTGTWASHGEPTPENGVWDIQGSAGGIAWAGDSVRLRPRGSNDAQEVPLADLPAEQRAGALLAFLEAVATGETPETDAAANLGTLELLLAALASVEHGTEVDVRAAAPEVGLVAASPSSPVPVGAPGR